MTTIRACAAGMAATFIVAMAGTASAAVSIDPGRFPAGPDAYASPQATAGRTQVAVVCRYVRRGGRSVRVCR